jgi:DNA-directed RNA polymerase II subunit RPB2
MAEEDWGQDDHDMDADDLGDEIDRPVTQEDAWKIVTCYFDKKGLVGQQLDSFDEFIGTKIQELVDDAEAVEVTPMNQYDNSTVREDCKYVIKFGQIYVSKPTTTDVNNRQSPVWPAVARMRNMTYHSPVYMDVTCTECDVTTGEALADREPMENEKELIGNVPIMLRSTYCTLADHGDRSLCEQGECVYDQGGYFIINGSEKVVVAQERMANNQVYCFKKKEPHKYMWTAECRSHIEHGARPTSTLYTVMYAKSKSTEQGKMSHRIRTMMPGLRVDLPVVILFRALGFIADRDILEHICYDFQDFELMERFRPSLEEAFVTQDQNQSLDYIGRRCPRYNIPRAERIAFAKEKLQRDMLPHIGTEANNETKKAFYLGYIVHKILMCSLDRRAQDDRDHFANKRMDLAGALLGSQFRLLFTKMTKDIYRSVQKCVDAGKEVNLGAAIRSKTISGGLKNALGTGNWGERDQPSKTGVSQALNRLTYASSLSHLRRCNTSFGKDGKLARPRQLHNTQWGMICPAETPEGSQVGLVKNMSLMASISVGSPINPILTLLHDWSTQGLDSIHPEAVTRGTKVFVNGNWIGINEWPDELYTNLKKLRRQMDINPEVSIIRQISDSELQIRTESGRMMRPLLIVEDQKLKLTSRHIQKLKDDPDYAWENLRQDGLIELIDVEEEESAMIAMDVSSLHADNYVSTYTHCEIHPSMILGVCASIIPFPDHNQSPRNVYQSAMGKQAMGMYASNFQMRMDTQGHLLYYPQKPLVTTRAMEFLKFRELPSGINAVVAIMTYSGYNQEDSLIMNQSAIDRGFFRSIFYRTYRESEENKNGSEAETIEKPKKFECVGRAHGSGYEKLDWDGLVAPGTRVSGGDILIGKTVPIQMTDDQFQSKFKKRDKSMSMRAAENGIVDKVCLTITEDGNKFCKVRIRSERRPQVGDKFASRHGQKGTIGMTYRQEDMPWTMEGITPDIIVNPHAIPSRMTIGHLIECLLSKVATKTGNEGDATPFMPDITVDKIADALHDLGYQRYGNEVLYSGHTGMRMTAKIFFGPTFYQRLKHMVADKIHSRARGPTQKLTRQPLEGRARDGGLRMGEMERDCLVSHGTAGMLKDRLMANSDAYRIHVCSKCGLPAHADPKKNMYFCRLNECKGGVVYEVKLPYACKLLFQELMAMAITPRLICEPGDHAGFRA